MVDWQVDQLIYWKKGRQKRPQSIGQAKAKKAGEAAVDRQVDQLICLKKGRQNRPQSIGRAIGSQEWLWSIGGSINRSSRKKGKRGCSQLAKQKQIRQEKPQLIVGSID